MANVVGQRVLRREDPRFLTGRGMYVDDVPAADPLYVTFVRSSIAHATIASTDVNDARAIPGVHVFTAADVDLPRLTPPPFLPIDERMFRPVVAGHKVRFAGEIVAVVLGETRATSVDAAGLVSVDYEPLPTVIDMRDAVRDEVLLFEDVGTNAVLRETPPRPDPELLTGCDVVISGSNKSQRLAACPLEPRAGLAMFEDGKLTIWLTTQSPHHDQDTLAHMLGLSRDDVRVIAPDVGGGFGGKGLINVDEVLVAWCARKTGRAVRWTETRGEHMTAAHHGRSQVIDFELGGTRDGRIEALRVDILQDAGAYPGNIGAFLAKYTAMMSSGVYAIPRIETKVTAVVTNATPTGPVRGAGRPEAAQMIERAVDMYAAEIGLDPAEVRRRNFIPTNAFPYTTATGAVYDIGDYPQALERVLTHADYHALRREQEQRRRERSTRLLGIGLSVYVEVTNAIAEGEYGLVEITADGGAIVRTGSSAHGQGHETTFAQIAADRLGLPLDRVRVVASDTGQVARGGGTYASKSTQAGGAAARVAADGVVERAKRFAADVFEADVADVVLDTAVGRFHVAGSPQVALAWSDVASRLNDAGRLAELQVENDFKPTSGTYPFGADVAVVEVDAETGSVQLVKLFACDDAGTIINPIVAEGQVHGGIAAGVAQALFEEVGYDADGNPLNANLATYLFPSAADLPTFETTLMETPTPVNPLGAKGIGESGTIGATPAVHNAVLDALAPYGVRHLDMPVNGERVWRAIHEATGA